MGTVPKSRLAESSDDYPRVLVRLGDRWRVIVCKDGIQWIIQHRVNNGPMRWRGKAFCTSRLGLLQRLRTLVGDAMADDALAALNLPDHIHESSQ